MEIIKGENTIYPDGCEVGHLLIIIPLLCLRALNVPTECDILKIVIKINCIK